jgi:hypothetical protein
VVAGACSNLKLRTQKSRPDGAADARDHESQLEMVAGARNHLNLRLLSTYRRILEQVAMADHRDLFTIAYPRLAEQLRACDGICGAGFVSAVL